MSHSLIPRRTMLKLALSGVVAASAGYPVKGAEGVADPSPLPIPAGKPIVIKSVEFVKYQRPQTGWAGWPKDKGKPFPFVACRIVAENGSSVFRTGECRLVARSCPRMLKLPEEAVGQDARKVEELHDRVGGPLISSSTAPCGTWLPAMPANPCTRSSARNATRSRPTIPRAPQQSRKSRSAAIASGRSTPGRSIDKNPSISTQAMPESASMDTHEPPLSPPERCIEFFRQAREALGNDFTILADCHYHYVDPEKHHPWTIEDAVKLGKGLKEVNIFWLEGCPG